MANNRDVKITIKAKDEASKVIAAVKQALDKYGSGADGVSKKIAPLGDKFKKLTGEVSKLQTELQKTKGQFAINEQFKIATDALSKLSGEFKKNTSALSENKAALSKSQADLKSYSETREDLKNRLKSERDALSDLTKTIGTHTRGLDRAQKIAKGYSDTLASQEAKVARHRATLAAATETQRRATQEDERAARTVGVLTARLADLRASREAQRRSLTGKGGVSAEYDAATRVSRQGAEFLPGSFSRSAAASASIFVGNIEGEIRSKMAELDAEIARVEKVRLNAERTRAATSANRSRADQGVRTVQADFVRDDNTTSLKAKLAAVNAEIAKHESELEKAKAAHSAFGEATNISEAALQELNAQYQVSYNEVQRLESEARKLEKALVGGEDATNQATAALKELEAVAKSGGLSALGQSAEVLEKRLQMLEARLAETAEKSARLSKYADGAGNFTGADTAARLRKMNASLEEAKADAQAFKDEIEQLNRAIARGDGGRKEMGDEIRKLAQAMTAAETDARDLAHEIRKIGIENGSLKRNVLDFWKQHNNESRTALSLYQRIRGQVLSLIAAYGGLYGAASAIQAISEAYMKQEAALSRLGVVFDGNTERMTVEFDWIRREASRLGIEFGVLADQYTKFAVAAKTSGFSEGATRKIFTSVSEAARVNKLGTEDIKGIYLALSQMISKGKIGAEELRQQLGERLPGAMTLMANAIGVTTAQLDKMMKEGQVVASEENLIKFAEELHRTFGKQLPASLRTFTTEWGKLQNSIFQAKSLIGKGGVIGALTDAMKELNAFADSEEGVKFFLGLGNAMGEVISYAPKLIENFETIISTVKMLATIGIIAVFNRWTQAAMQWGGALISSMSAVKAIPGSMTAMIASIRAGESALVSAKVAVRGLGAAFATLGPIAAGLTVGSMLFDFLGSWEDGIDKITEAQAQHERVMDAILTKYDAAKGKTYDWKDAIDEKNKSELLHQLTPDTDAYSLAVRNFKGQVSGLDALKNMTLAEQILPFGSNHAVANSSAASVWNADDFVKKYGVPQEAVDKLKSQWESVTSDIDHATKEDFEKLKGALGDVIQAIPDSEIKDKLLKLVDGITAIQGAGTRASETITVLRETGQAVDDANNLSSRFAVTMEQMSGSTSSVVEAMNDAKDAVNEAFIAPIENALKEAGAFGKDLKDLDLTKTITDPFTGGKRTIGEMMATLDMLKGKMPELQNAFKSFAEDGALDKLAEKLSWMKMIPQLGAVLDSFRGKNIGQALQDGKVTADFEKTVGTAKGAELSELVTEVSKLAEEMGVSAKDLLTVIGYETGGTFDKWQKGPVTQYGQHRGLIQWGEPQRAEYGVTENSTIAEQVAAVGKYLQAAGVRNGMGILDIYSAINAGHVGRYSASDANNGGAPGTVRDKVYSANMADHAANAKKLLELYAPSADTGQAAGKLAADTAQDIAKAAVKAIEDAKKADQNLADDKKAVAADLEIERMKVAGKEREAFIQEKINAFTEKHKNLTKEEIAALKEQFGQQYDLQQLQSKEKDEDKKIRDQKQDITRLEAERNSLLEQREIYKSRGDSEGVANVNERLVAVNAELDAAITKFIEFWKASNSPDAKAAIADLENTKLQIKDTGREALMTADDINTRFAGGISDAFGAFAEALANGENGFKSMREAFLKFAADFLIQIGQMIIQATILKALQGTGGAGGFGGMVTGFLGSITTGLFHTGKGATQTRSANQRTVSPAIFASAPRFHSGKLPGLRSGEMAAIIREDEEVIPPSDPRHSWNQKGATGLGGASAGQGGGAGDATIVNTFDAESFLQAGLASPSGRKLFMNFVKANKAAFKGVLS